MPSLILQKRTFDVGSKIEKEDKHQNNDSILQKCLVWNDRKATRRLAGLRMDQATSIMASACASPIFPNPPTIAQDV